MIEESVAGFKIRVVIDAKYYDKKIDVKDVESFLGMLVDVDANKGMMISPKGYSKAAVNRAFNDTSDLELDVLSFDDLLELQSYGAVAHSGQYGVILPAPFGWVVDGASRDGMVACLYQRGLDLEKAIAANEWMYINFWSKAENPDVNTVKLLIKHQENYTKKDFPEAVITYSEGPFREYGKTHIRTAVINNYPTPEYTGFIDFDDFIFFCVLFSPIEQSKKNVRKLEQILANVTPLNVTYEKSDEKVKHKRTNF